MNEIDILRRILGLLITALRTQHDITQAALADTLHAAQSTISRVERGEAPVEWLELPRYLAALKHADVDTVDKLMAAVHAIKHAAHLIASTVYTDRHIGDNWWEAMTPAEALGVLNLGVARVIQTPTVTAA